MSTGNTRADSWLDSVAFHAESETYRAEFDPETTDASIAVIGALAELTATDPTDFEPLYEAVDTDALNAIIRSPGTTSDTEVSFAFAGQDVTVDSGGTVAVDTAPTPLGDDATGQGPAE